MENKNKKLIIIISILLVLVTGITFAYFMSKARFTGSGNIARGTTANINGATILVEGELEFQETDFLPGHQMVSAIKVTATGNNELIPFTIIWDGVNDLSDLNYKVYRTTSEVTGVRADCHEVTTSVGGRIGYSENCTILNGSSLGKSIQSGKILKNENKVVTNLVEDEFITATSGGNVAYYYVILEYPNLNSPQNSEMGHTFRGNINIIESNANADINIIGAYIKKADGTEELTTEIPNGYVITSSNCTESATASGTTPNIKVTNLTRSGTNCTLHLEQSTASKLIATADKTSIITSAGFGAVETGPGGLYEFEGITNGTKTQFYRGAVTNNYVKLGTSGNETYWRIVRFDEDKNIRLIYDGSSAHTNGEASNDRVLTTNYDGTNMITQKYYGDNGNPAYVGWTWISGQQWPNEGEEEYPNGGNQSSMKIYLENNWLPTFKNKLSDKEKDALTIGKYCNDRTLESGSWNVTREMYYGARARLDTNKTPSFACDTRDTYMLEVGLITADEPVYI